MSKHTLGPWEIGGVFDNDGIPEIVIIHKAAAGNLGVATALGGLRAQEANAHLIAAAPDLLEALKAIVKSLDDQDDEGLIEHAQQMIDARAAIAKATGAQP
jgi:hypothetical protein